MRVSRDKTFSAGHGIILTDVSDTVRGKMVDDRSKKKNRVFFNHPRLSIADVPSLSRRVDLFYLSLTFSSRKIKLPSAVLKDIESLCVLRIFCLFFSISKKFFRTATLYASSDVRQIKPDENRSTET